jgi:PAT family beta-lactamase induction signal transducer AmpG
MKSASILDDFVKIYLNQETCSKFFVGFSCGIPFLLTLTILDVWLKEYGVSNTAIGLFTLIHWPFGLKFLWAPFIDKFDFPILSKLLGRRRGWAIASQSLLFVGLTGMSLSDPGSSLVRLMMFSSIVAFADGCQDMSLYAYQMDKFKTNMLGPVAGVVLFGYRSGMFFTKSTALYLAHYFGWGAAYSVMSLSVFLCAFFILSIKEPKVQKTSHEDQIKDMVKAYENNNHSPFEFIHVLKTTIFECLICPFKIFMKKHDWKKLISIVVLFRAGDILAQKMLKLFYIDIGFSTLEIANVVQVFGTVATMIGGIIGGYFIKNFGLKKVMIYTSIAHALSCFLFIAFSITGYNIYMLYFTVFTENVTGGAMGTSFIAFLYSLCDKHYCATQYALLWAFYDCGGAFCRTISGMLADLLGWTQYFLLVAIMFIPGITIIRSFKKKF